MRALLTTLLLVAMANSPILSSAQRLLLTLHLNQRVCSSPCRLSSRIEVGDNIRGGVCLVWDSPDEGTSAGQDCWSAEQRGRFVNREMTLRAPGTYQVWVAAEKVLSNT